jgi:hypothetical protein
MPVEVNGNLVRVPITLIAVLLSAMLTLTGYFYASIGSQMKDTQSQLMQLRIDVAVLQHTVDPSGHRANPPPGQ